MYHAQHIWNAADLAVTLEPFPGQEFVAPALRGSEVCASIGGVDRVLRLEAAEFEGWGVFEPSGRGTARLLCRATLAERTRYLSMLPAIRLILCGGQRRSWQALPAHRHDCRVPIDGTVPVFLTEEARLFSEVVARFDGLRCWYERLDPCGDPAVAAHLRRALEETIEPEQLDLAGLTGVQREAYTRAFRTRFLQGAAHDVSGPHQGQNGRSVLHVAGLPLAAADASFDLESLKQHRAGQDHTSSVPAL